MLMSIYKKKYFTLKLVIRFATHKHAYAFAQTLEYSQF